jgi:L-rhamnose mutarotase
MSDYSKSTSIPNFKRYCKVLKLQDNKDLINKYIDIHKSANIWPEIPRGIREVGIIDMEIWLYGNQAFMIMDTVPDFDHDKAMKKLAGLPKQKEWEEFVSQFQQAGDKADTPEKWQPIERIFRLE